MEPKITSLRLICMEVIFGMKKIVSLLLVMFMLASTACAEEGETVVPGNRLGFEALRVLNDGTQNRVFSPVSLSYALAMAAQGAEGETQEQILVALDAEDVAEVTSAEETPVQDTTVSVG